MDMFRNFNIAEDPSTGDLSYRHKCRRRYKSLKSSLDDDERVVLNIYHCADPDYYGSRSYPDRFIITSKGKCILIGSQPEHSHISSAAQFVHMYVDLKTAIDSEIIENKVKPIIDGGHFYDHDDIEEIINELRN